MITLAFYHGRGDTVWHRVQDAAIRFATRGRFSHVELVAGPARAGEVAACYSSSGRDGGVRVKDIRLDPKKWVLVAFDADPTAAVAFMTAELERPYDYRGILLSQVFALARHNRWRWFCSELVAAALGFPEAQRVSPQMLYDMVAWAMRVAPKGRVEPMRFGEKQLG